MRRLNTETLHTKQASYFGIVSIVSYLIFNAVRVTYRYTDYPLPKIIFIASLLLFILTSIFSFIHALKSRREPYTPVTSRLRIYVGLCFLFWVYLIIYLRDDILSMLAW